MGGRKVTQETLERITGMYPTMTASEIAAELGISTSTIIRYAQECGVRHTAETVRRIMEMKRQNLTGWRKTPKAKAIYVANGRKLSKMHRVERWRAMGGMKQKTKLRLGLMPQRVRNVVYRVARQYGYLYATNSKTLWYDAQTERDTKREQYYTRKYGLRFLPDRNEEKEEE